MDRAFQQPTIELTPGDPGGIGPEVMLAAWWENHTAASLRLAGDPRVWLRAADQLGIPCALVQPALGDGSAGVELPPLGQATDAGAQIAWQALDAALARVLAGQSVGLVTGPIAKATMLAQGFPCPGHTEYLAHRSGAERVLMVMYAPKFVVGLSTVHIPLRAVADVLTSEAIIEDGRLLLGFLRQIGVGQPRLAICGINPHAGEGGALGDEDARVAAAVTVLRDDGFNVSGPWPGDTVFAALAAGEYDAVLAMYHDQGLAPFKLRHFYDGVNVTVGLPFVRTSPDHGTAFSLAARGGADPASAKAAVRLALELIKQGSAWTS